MNNIYVVIGFGLFIVLAMAVFLIIINSQISRKISGAIADSVKDDELKESQTRVALLESFNTINEKINSSLLNGFKENSEMLAKISSQSQGISSVIEMTQELQRILNDKQLRGAWGEKQLEFILDNSIPEDFRIFQHTYSNGSRVDAAVRMPSGSMLSVDSKFPLDNFKTLIATGDKSIEKLFKQDIKKHIDDISSKYIISEETEDKAIMFIPSESIFISLNNDYYDLVNYANKKKVWIASPSTLALIMSNVNHLISDVKARKNIAKVKDLLAGLTTDLERLEQRFSQSKRLAERSVEDLSGAEVSLGKVVSKIHKIIDL